MEKKNHLIALVVTTVCLCASVASAFDPLGPPTTSLNQSEVLIRMEYLRGNMDVKCDSIPDIDLGSATIENIESNKFYVTLGVGAADGFELFGRVGTANAEPDKGDNANNIAGYIGDSDYNASIGGGLKATLFKSEDKKLSWGLLAQVSTTRFGFDKKSYTVEAYDETLSTKIRVTEAQFAFGPTYNLTEGVWVYGGPFIHVIDGKADLKGTIDDSSEKVSADIEQDSVLGGYIGTQIRVAQNTAVNVEFQATGAGSAIGASMVYKF